jgi:hypothetical protein
MIKAQKINKTKLIQKLKKLFSLCLNHIQELMKKMNFKKIKMKTLKTI